MQHFYKFIEFGPQSWFYKTYGVDTPEDLCLPQIFQAKSNNYEWCLTSDHNGYTCPHVAMLTPEPVIHFSDNAFDTLMWYYHMQYRRGVADTYFYVVRPLSPIYKDRCYDGRGLYQCGANKIEIIRQISIGDLFRNARYEIRANGVPRLITRYPNINVMKYIVELQKQNPHMY